MPEEQVTLITLLKEVISNYEKKLEKLQIVNNSALTKNREKIEAFRGDISKILDIDMDVVESILEETDGNALEKDTIFKYLRSIQLLLRMNLENHTSFQIQDSQLEYVKLFFQKVDELDKKNTIMQNNNIKNIGKLSSVCEKYREMLELLQNPNSHTFLVDLDFIASLFQECDLDEKTKRSILISIMKYNQDVYNRQLQDNQMDTSNGVLSVDELADLLNKYGYDFYQLDKDVQNDLLVYGNKTRIQELLDCMKSCNLPVINLRKNGNIFGAILLNCEKDVFINILNYGRSKGLSSDNLLDILPALIVQNRDSSIQSKKKRRISDNKKKKDRVDRGKSGFVGISGRCDDFIENVEFFEEKGIDVSYVYKKCKEVLIMNHQRLVDNYKAFTDYGFSFELDDDGKLLNVALSCLILSNFVEILDQFIESCPEGYDYIKNNMSGLCRFSSGQDLVFYNIYASNMSQDEYGIPLRKEGPFVNSKAKRLRLRGEITRYIGSGYESIPYRGVEEENKVEKTMTIIPPIDNREIFEDAVLNAESSDDVFSEVSKEDERLKGLDTYIDSKNSYLYNFDGVLISRLKVSRIFHILKESHVDGLNDSLLYAITYNTIINESDFMKLKKLVMGNKKKL